MDSELLIPSDELEEGEVLPLATSQRPDESFSEVVESSSTVVAHQSRRARTVRPLPVDYTMELRNKDLADWNANYLQNMNQVARIKQQYKRTQRAKKNAAYWVWGSGIGGIATRLKGITFNPLNDFIGNSFFELYTGINKKHDRDSGIDEATQRESRRVRQKTDELADHLGRGQDDEALFLPGGDDIELPREAPLALDDEQLFSAMPWNITASVRGSSTVPRSGRIGLPSSLSRTQTRPGSRMISASPLARRSQPGDLEALESLQHDEYDLVPPGSGGIDFPGQDFSSDMGEADVDGQYVRVNEALSAEGGNFLDFIFDAIDEKRDRMQVDLEIASDVSHAETPADADEISFEDLLPPTRNSKVVAAQALMMTLTLGTKDMLKVHQDSDFGEISLSLSDQAKKSRINVPIDHFRGQDPQDPGLGGQFEEQIITVEERSDDDDVDSLYAD